MTDSPGAASARDALHQQLVSHYRATADAGSTLARVVMRAHTQPDLVVHYADTAAAIIALEDVVVVAAQAVKDLRSALALSMQDTGCPQVAAEDFTVYLAREPSFLEVIDPAGIPPDLWTKPKPEPDRAAIKRALDQGRSIPGASMNVRNSMRLTIRGKSR